MGSNRQPVVAPIQALRGLAAWMVVYHHYLQIFYDFQYSTSVGHFFAGYGGFGVDIFFVISGFVMFASLQRRARSAAAFWSERITRIVPNYWFHMLILLVALPLQDLPHWRSMWSPTSLFGSFFFVPVEDPGGNMFPFLRVGWTLNFEMFFYGFLALCILATGKRAALLAGVLLVLSPIVWKTDWPGEYILASWKLPEFSVGICIAAVVSRGIGPLANRTLLGAGVIGTAFGILVFVHIPFNQLVCSGLVVFGAAMCSDKSFDNALGHFACHLGDISYSTYLNHTIVWSAAYFLAKATGLFGMHLVVVPVVTLAIYACSVWTYRNIEVGFGKQVISALVARVIPALAR